MVIIETDTERKAHVIRPSAVRLTKDGHTQCAFGKFEVEVTAGRLVQFFQRKGYWSAFRLTELFEFYRQNGWNPDTMLFGLIGRWHDDGGWGSRWREANRLGVTVDGDLCVTEEFVSACARSMPAAA